jgi:hypothetical protein
MTNCKNCNEPTDGKYCSNCGQAIQLKRIDGHYILHEIEHIVHFESGILYTIKELLIHPGKTVREFITDNRNRLVKPIIFIIITSLIYTLVIHFFDDKNEFIKISETGVSGTEKSIIFYLFKWVQQHYGYSNLMWGLFVAFWAKVFFRKYDYNYFEIMILLCFVQGIFMLILAVDALFVNTTHLDSFRIGGFLGLGYITWAIGQFFGGKKLINYAKALASFMLGMITFLLSGVLIGSFIDLIIKHLK